MKENFDLFDFSLTENEINRSKELDLGKSQFIDHYAPDVAEMFVNAGKIQNEYIKRKKDSTPISYCLFHFLHEWSC